MTTNEILSQVELIYRRILKNEKLILSPGTTAHDVDGWDSLNHTILMTEVQKHFHIKFSLKEIIKFRNIGDMVNLLSEKLSD
jgi:acyl carrier protein